MVYRRGLANIRPVGTSQAKKTIPIKMAASAMLKINHGTTSMKIDHVAEDDTVDEVTCHAGNHQPEAQLRTQAGLGVWPVEHEQHTKPDGREHDEPNRVPAE